MPEELRLTLANAAELAKTLGRPVSPKTLQWWCRDGRLPYEQVGEGRRATYYVTRADLGRALELAPRRGGYRGRRNKQS